ncbi:NLE1 [Hepatospora eriocheir]|uniref:NLE1 n=1 Tax=Hepatospora eriocheir TaxID=1081669 RepID=A0A1X0QF84_9MICR|nr:NLE1 [Hepatospora eriocheir]
MTDVIQVPIDITDDSLRQIIKKDNILYIDGNVLTGSIKNSLNGDVDYESVFLIRVANRKPTTPATFCSSSYSGHEGPVLKCKIINKQLAVTVGDDKTVRFWDLITKTQFMINKAHDHWVLHCEKYKNFVVTAGMDSKICVFDFKGNLIDQIKKKD